MRKMAVLCPVTPGLSLTCTVKIWIWKDGWKPSIRFLQKKPRNHHPMHYVHSHVRIPPGTSRFEAFPPIRAGCPTSGRRFFLEAPEWSSLAIRHRNRRRRGDALTLMRPGISMMRRSCALFQHRPGPRARSGLQLGRHLFSHGRRGGRPADGGDGDPGASGRATRHQGPRIGMSRPLRETAGGRVAAAQDRGSCVLH